MAMAIATFLVLLLSFLEHSAAAKQFDVRQHLSTVSRYGAVKEIAGNAFRPSNIPDGCSPIHLNLVARHGTHFPTKKRIRELDTLATHVESLLKDVKEQNLSSKKVPSWLWGWTSPWKGNLKSGELTGAGEDELYHLGIRIQERFPDLFNEEYHPDVFTIKATQVPRASASAVAFGMGLFSGRGSLGPGHQRAFAVISESHASDILLRFFDCCKNYKDFTKSQEPAVDKLKEPVIDEITTALKMRNGLNFTRQDTSSLWFLCKQEASLLDITDQACGLFSPSEVALLEWTDDLELFILKGYGKSLNYKMGVPLLKDVFDSMEQAIEAKEGNYAPGSYEKARLRFAHAETVIPFSCLLGLFLEESEFKQIQREEPLQYPPKSPQKRNFRGSMVAPFAGNNMLVLYSCPANSSSKYFVQVLHNENPIPMPGCDNSDLCPFEVFKERIVTPHMKHEYDALCNVNPEKDDPKPAPRSAWSTRNADLCLHKKHSFLAFPNASFRSVSEFKVVEYMQKQQILELYLFRKVEMALRIATFLIILLSVFEQLAAGEPFNVQQHLSTVSRYGAVKDIADSAFVPSKVPDGCSPIHLNLVARHGTRSPTKKRIRELDNLATHLESLLRDVKEQNLSLKKVPAWLWGWKSPWKGKVTGGELTDVGEVELYHLAIRIRERFPDLFNEEYHPDVFTIKTTQVPRASASAVAFGMGLFSARGSLGPGHQRAFALTSESRASDILLRFFDCCQNYKDFRKSQEPAVDELKEPIFDEITAALRKRYGLNFTRQDTSSLWFLCKQEASLLDIIDQACGLFSPSEAALLEWTDDLELFILKGYGKSLNFRMGVPLLKDVFQSMEQAIKAKEENHAPGSYEKARLRFAHAETVVPFSCLLGLFLEQSEFKQIQREQPLQYPPKPPQKRNWRGSTVAPFAGNNMLVLYSCPANSSSKYFVQVLHNEHPIPMPGCDNSDLCPFEVFKERIVSPHMKHEYHTVCNVKLEKPEQKPTMSKLSRLFHWLFSQGNDDTRSLKVDL